jgi:ParB family chromosome partitioning protein
MRRALGKGLSQLLAEQTDASATEIAIDRIAPNPRQPRRHFDAESLAELAASIREYGVIQPLLVRPVSEGSYELIAGERRLRAAKEAGLESVPVTIRSATGQNSLELAIIENLQREDINAMECARAYQHLIQDFGLTQEQVSVRVGKSRTAVANQLRLLRLPELIQEGVESGAISEGHARALLATDSPSRQLALYEKILVDGLSVRETERLAKAEPRPVAAKTPTTEAEYKDPVLIQTLREHFSAPVRIQTDGKRGKLSIEFFSEEDLTRIVERLGIQLDGREHSGE